MKHRRPTRAMAGAVALVAAVFAALVVLDHMFPPNLSKLADRSVIVVDRDGRMLQAFTARDGRWRLPVTVDDVDPRYPRMLIAYEDKRFDRHPGVDPLAIGRAVTQWIAHGRVVSGASTLTMQTVRLLQPRRRTIGAKFIEMARALQLEWRFSKRQILEFYLALAPFGGNIEGVRAASLFYFGKEPKQLTDAEAALLVALPQSPEKLRPDRNNRAARAKRDRILARMTEVGVLSAQSGMEATQQSVPSDRLPAIRSASHLAERLRADHADEMVIRSFVDADLQLPLEALARRYHGDLEDAATLAILVVENAGRRVRAYIGSGDYFDERRFGQNDMVTAVRSPGSALKPLIYGLAFDELLIHPETIIVDQPMRFGDYAPENFDHFYRGEVSVKEALQMSLNLPAVAVLNRLGPLRLVQALKSAGAPPRLPDDVSSPGLPVALGGAGTTLQDLVMLYAGLAEGGRVRPLRLIEQAPNSEPVAIVGEAAAWYLTGILRDSPPPPNAVASRHRLQSDTVAFKTGTSYGFRDAWAIGYTERYTVGIWVGRPDGSFSPGRMGRDVAAPLLFEVFDMLPAMAQTASLALDQAPPHGVIIASNADLPPALQRFDDGSSGFAALVSDQDKPRIEFPAPGVTLDVARDGGGFSTLILRATGGELPLRWLVNGALVPSAPYRRQAAWRPDGEGAARVTVMDRAGLSSSVEVWIE